MPRFKITWVSQNEVSVEDSEKDDLFYMDGCLKVIERFEALPEAEADLFLAGFLEGVDFCDSQLKHCIHNFIRRE